MTSRPVRYHRKRLRAINYDYSSAGMYLVTISTNHMERRFGTVQSALVQLNHAGLLVETVWMAIPERFSGVDLDEWIVMPNHLHGIIALETVPNITMHTLGAIVGAFKSLTTVGYARGVGDGTFPRFDRSLWQRGFHDHLIRSQISLEKVREYISGNPAHCTEREDSH